MICKSFMNFIFVGIVINILTLKKSKVIPVIMNLILANLIVLGVQRHLYRTIISKKHYLRDIIFMKIHNTRRAQAIIDLEGNELLVVCFHPYLTELQAEYLCVQLHQSAEACIRQPLGVDLFEIDENGEQINRERVFSSHESKLNKEVV